MNFAFFIYYKTAEYFKKFNYIYLADETIKWHIFYRQILNESFIKTVSL